MGADIWGWVETRACGAARWAATIRIRDLVYRQYGMFASLFGVRNGVEGKATEQGRFQAIAFGRGAPPEASHWYTEERDQRGREEGAAYGGAVGETWVLWSELAAIDWEEEGEYYRGDEPPHVVFAEPGPARRRE